MADDDKIQNFFSDSRKLRLLEWVLMPPHEREPRSQRGLAEELGVAPRTLRDWQNTPLFRARWETEARALMGTPERIQRVIDAMYEAAIDDTNPRQMKAAELFVRWYEANKPPSADEAVKNAAELSDAELDALLAQAALEESKRRTSA